MTSSLRISEGFVDAVLARGLSDRFGMAGGEKDAKIRARQCKGIWE